MLKYKLIKKYPGGPTTIGLVVYEQGPFYESHFATENAEHFHQTRNMVEEFPEFWQEYVELDVPVGTTFRHKSDDEKTPEIYKIESTDGVYVVISWKIRVPGTIAYTVKSVNDYFKDSTWIKSKQPLRISEDGVELFEGDIMHRVSLVSNYSLDEVKVRKELPEPISYFKDFSTKELAQEYIDLYKPQYSMQDILNASAARINDNPMVFGLDGGVILSLNKLKK